MSQSTDLPRSTPEAEGVSSASIEAFIQAVERANLGVQSFVLIKCGRIVADGWWEPYQADIPHLMFSVSKSFTSTAIGFAVSEGLLSVDEPLLKFFPEHVTPEIEANMGELRIKHLLSMSTGHDEDTMIPMRANPDADWVRIFLSVPIKHRPGTHFLYNSGASYVLSAIVQKLTGQTAFDFLTPRLFQPLGITDVTWQTNRAGVNLGASGLRLKTLDLAKFGQLLLQEGVWQGNQVLSKAWIDEATSAQVSNGDDPNNDWNQGYGYQFWRCRHGAYRADGAFGQLCIVMPHQDAVLAVTSGSQSMHGIFDAVWEHLLPAMDAASPSRVSQAHSAEVHGAAARDAVARDALAHGAVAHAGETLSNATSAFQSLTEKCQSLSMPVPQFLSSPGAPGESALSDLVAQVSDTPIRLDTNPLGATDIFFRLPQAERGTLEVKDAEGQITAIGFARDEWITSTTRLWHYEEPPTPLSVATRGGWTDSHTLLLVMQYLDTPFRQTLKFDFADMSNGRVEVDIELDLPFWDEHKDLVQGRIRT